MLKETLAVCIAGGGLTAAHYATPMLLKYSATAARVCAVEERPSRMVNFKGVCPPLFAVVRSKGAMRRFMGG